MVRPKATPSRSTTSQKTPSASLSTKSRKQQSPQKRAGPSFAANKASIPKNQRKILKEIRFYQNNTDFLIPKAPFVRVVRDIQQPFIAHNEGYRWTPEALMALQTAAEAYLVGLFADAVLLTYHARRVTLFVQDIRLARRIRGRVSDI
eukprot:Platyproteum_vivax@DN258_c0_g1_i1.p1